ncbi:hypothetical protein BGZ91_004608 [Linnemannia elongata]|nr:hypothetical protein BGZ91_004608 [Linnemannia elongata]KAG0058640.1 hypothetical protein BGZ90_004853 [Linnemannia elongata]
MRHMKNDIEVLDVTYHLDNGYLKLKGWTIKPDAILGSKFEEAIFIDADSYFLRIRFELVQEPCAFVRNYGGVIGELKADDDQSICGARMNLDYLGGLL